MQTRLGQCAGMSLDGGATLRQWSVLPSVLQTNGFEACACIECELKVAVRRHVGTRDVSSDKAEHRSQRRVLVGDEAVPRAAGVDEDKRFPEQANNHAVDGWRLAGCSSSAKP